MFAFPSGDAAAIDWISLLPPLIAGIAVVLTAVVAVLGGMLVYFRQKEFELVKQRYLDEGLDVLIGAAEEMLNIFHHNWARALEILKLFRDSPTFDPEELDRGFIDLPPSRWALTAHYRVNALVGDTSVWKVFQVLMAFCQHGSATAKFELPDGIRSVMTSGCGLTRAELTSNSVKASKAELVGKAFELLSILDKDAEKHHIFVEQMQRISSVLETRRFRFKAIRKFRKDDAVKQALAGIKAAFREELERAEEIEQATEESADANR